MIKSILVPLTGQSNCTSICQAGANIAFEFKATLTGLFVKNDPRSAIPFMGEGLTAEMVQQLCDASEQENAQAEAKAHATFRAQVEKAGLKCLDESAKTSNDKTNDALVGQPLARWQSLVGEITDHVGRRARVSDLSICAMPDDNAGEGESIFNDLLFRSGRPLLMVPEGASDTIANHVVIAWNGRAEGARAVGAAMPFLTKAAKVTILQVGTIEEDRPQIDAIEDYLALHGINVHIHMDESKDGSVGKHILTFGQENGCDLLIIGAYSHARWREMIIGGVTKHIVANATMPVFMSH